MSARFYYSNGVESLENSLNNNLSVLITDELFRYIINVRRFRVGEEIDLFCGDGWQYLAKIVNIQKKALEVKLINKKLINCEADKKVHLFMSVIANDKMDYAIQKSVELGVWQITPLVSEYSQIRGVGALQKKLRHWQAVIISACEQCGRNTVAQINPAVKFSDFIKNVKAIDENITLVADINGSKFSNINVFTDEKLTKNLNENINANTNKNINVLIGPEGGFSKNESAQFEQLNFNIISLGSTVLRAETAAVAMLAKILL